MLATMISSWIHIIDFPLEMADVRMGVFAAHHVSALKVEER